MTNEKLIELQNIVLPVMRILTLIDQEMEKKLKEIPLGLIRKNATRMHAVCRFKAGPKGYKKTIEDVKEVAIHPEAIDGKWVHYRLNRTDPEIQSLLKWVKKNISNDLELNLELDQLKLVTDCSPIELRIRQRKEKSKTLCC